MPTTVAPDSISRSASVDPMNPATPVTSAFIEGSWPRRETTGCGSWEDRQETPNPIGQPTRFALRVERRVHRVAAGQRRAVRHTNDLILEFHPHRRHDGTRRHDLQLVVVPGGQPIVAVHFDNRQREAVSFHLTIAPARETQQVGPANLEPHEIVRVVHDAHLVGFGVSNPKAADGAGDVHRVGATGRAAIAQALSSRVARSGSEVPKIAFPATRIRAPAATTRGAVFRSMPPSISIGAAVFPDRSRSARTSRTLDSLRGMKI